MSTTSHCCCPGSSVCFQVRATISAVTPSPMASAHPLRASFLPSAPPRPSPSSQSRRPRPARPGHQLLQKWLLLSLLAVLPLDAEGVTFYFGADGNPLSQHNIERIAERPSTLSNDELRSVYSFCSLLPLLQAAGKMQPDKRSSETCTQLTQILKPVFGALPKRGARQRRALDKRERPLGRLRTARNRRLRSATLL